MKYLLKKQFFLSRNRREHLHIPKFAHFPIFPFALGIVLLATLFTACIKEDIGDNGGTIDYANLQPTVTPKGTPIGAVYNQQVGAAGGTVQSPDGKIKLDIPAGALAANTNIGIQEITNTAPLGEDGKAYRLTPEGTQFDKPVTITMQYDPATTPDALVWVITQKDDGTWLGNIDPEVNETAHTVSAKINHFSDWGFGKIMKVMIAPDAPTVHVGDKIRLLLSGFLTYDEFFEALPSFYAAANTTVPLVPIHVPNTVNPPHADLEKLLKTLNFKHHVIEITQWTLDGQKAPVSAGSKGKLTVEKGSAAAEYTAPDKVPGTGSTVQVAVSLLVNGSSRAILFQNITIVDEEDQYVTLTIDGRKYEFTDAHDISFNLHEAGLPPLLFSADHLATPGFGFELGCYNFPQVTDNITYTSKEDATFSFLDEKVFHKVKPSYGLNTILLYYNYRWATMANPLKESATKVVADPNVKGLFPITVKIQYVRRSGNNYYYKGSFTTTATHDDVPEDYIGMAPEVSVSCEFYVKDYKY
jgi:hypothetical protein